MEPLRQTAYKIWIKSLITNPYVVQSGEWESNYVLVDTKKVSRVNLIANMIVKYISEDKNHIFVVLDDGSATIRVKTWNENTKLLADLNVGDIVLVIGRVRKYNEEVYILPEIVRKLDNPNWELLRKLELLKMYGKPHIEENPIVVNEETTYEVEEIVSVEVTSIPSRQKILNLIETLETEDGADFMGVLNMSGLAQDEAEDIINDLIKEGEIFEPKPGKLKLIG